MPASTASALIIRLPTMALSRPPSELGGGVIIVNSLGEMLLSPLKPRSPRMKASQTIPKIAASTDSIRNMPFQALRLL